MSDNMTTGGMIFLISAWSTVIGLLAFCMWKVFNIRRNASEDDSRLR